MKLKQLFFLITGLLLTVLSVEGVGDDSPQGRLLVVANGTIDQEPYLTPDLVYFVPEYSLASLENMLTATNAFHIVRESGDDGTFDGYLLNSDEAFFSTEQEHFLCISPALQQDKTGRDDDPVTDSSKATQEKEQWPNVLSLPWSNDATSFVQRLSSLLTPLWEWVLHSDNDSEEREANNTGFVLHEWPISNPEPAVKLSGSSFPFDPPPPPFMPGIPVKGFFDMPDWQFDYLLSLSWINQRLNQWFHDWYHPTSRKSGQPVSTYDLSMALERVKQESATNKILLRHWPLDASELLTQLTGKDLPSYHIPHQPETVMLYPVFILPQSASNSLEQTDDEFAGETCSICLTEFEDSDDVIKTPCSHLFHMDCLKRWLSIIAERRRMNMCPNCRHDQGHLIDFLSKEEITTTAERVKSAELAALHEVSRIVAEMQAGTGTWPDDEGQIYARLINAQDSGDSNIAQRARELRPLVDLYSVQHQVSRVQAGTRTRTRTRTWPDDDGRIYARLINAQDSGDSNIAQRARKLQPLVDLYSVQHQVSRVQAGTRTWPDDDGRIYARLINAQDSGDSNIAQRARKLRPLVDLYSVQHQVSRVQAGTGRWPDDDGCIYAKLISAQDSGNPDITQPARKLQPLVDLYSVQHQVSRVQAGTGAWPDDDGRIYARLVSAQDSRNSDIAQRARDLRLLADECANKPSRK